MKSASIVIFNYQLYDLFRDAEDLWTWNALSKFDIRYFMICDLLNFKTWRTRHSTALILSLFLIDTIVFVMHNFGLCMLMSSHQVFA